MFGHGFAGHKDNGAAQKFADRVLTKYKGIAVLIFNLPCHGDDVKKKMVLQDCMTYMSIVLDYIKTEFSTDKIYSYATSFGGYLVLKYIREYGNPFVKIALRCPAVNMAEVLTKTIMKNEELDMIRRGKTVQVGFDRKIEVNSQFLTDLAEGDIRKSDYIDFADDILILHGTKDEVVPFEAGEKFAENNLIEFIPVENADHRFQNPACMELATKKVLEFFDFLSKGSSAD
ncbi:MAG: alpha/beta hydrolase [Candidatus Choladocola sp.]|nr:alpha/beta hydrolase [Candidatus Choladocola sp.]